MINVTAGQKNSDIVCKSSDDWGDIYVIDYYNHRVLTFDSIYEQSRMDKDSPFTPIHEYTKAMLLALLFNQPKQVLLLGLGSGSLLRSLHHLYPQTIIDVVELREQVVSVAQQYFGLPTEKHITLCIDDADHFINESALSNLDIIFSDLYLAYDMDTLQSQMKFLDHCDRMLSDDGWLVMNFHQLPNINSSFMQLLQRLFTEVLVCKVPKGNFIVYAGKQALPVSISDCFDNLPNIEAALKTDFNYLTYRLSYL